MDLVQYIFLNLPFHVPLPDLESITPLQVDEVTKLFNVKMEGYHIQSELETSPKLYLLQNRLEPVKDCPPSHKTLHFRHYLSVPNSVNRKALTSLLLNIHQAACKIHIWSVRALWGCTNFCVWECCIWMIHLMQKKIKEKISVGFWTPSKLPMVMAVQWLTSKAVSPAESCDLGPGTKMYSNKWRVSQEWFGVNLISMIWTFLSRILFFWLILESEVYFVIGKSGS